MNPRTDLTPVGTVTVRALNPTTRRDTPRQDRSPFFLWPAATTAKADVSQGHHPAHSRHAISTREYQRGRAPTRSAPTRRGPPQPRPPPGRSLLVRSAGLKAKPLRGGYASLDPDRPNKHAQNRAEGRQGNGHPKPFHPKAALTLDRPFHIRKGTLITACA